MAAKAAFYSSIRSNRCAKQIERILNAGFLPKPPLDMLYANGGKVSIFALPAVLQISRGPMMNVGSCEGVEALGMAAPRSSRSSILCGTMW